MSLAKRFGIAAALEEINEEAAAAAAAAAETTPPTDGATPPTEETPPADAPATDAPPTDTPPVDETPVVPEPVEIPVVEDTAEEAMGEANAAATDIESAEDTINTAQDDADTLDNLADSMAASEATGGMDAASATIAQVAVERLMERLQISGKKPLPAMESFGGDSSRIKATKLAVENIREQVKNVMQALYNMLVKSYEFVKNFVKAALDGNARLKKRAEDLLAALEKASGTATSENLQNTGFASILTQEGKVTAKGVVDGLVATSSFIEGTSKLSAKVVEAMRASKEVSLLISNANNYASWTFKDITEGGWEAVSDDRFGKAEEGYTFFNLKGSELSGSKAFVVYTKTNAEPGQDSFDAAINTKMTLENVGEEPEIKEVPVATLEEAKAIVKGVIELCDKVEAAKGELGDIEKLQSEMAKEAKAAMASIKDDPEAAKRAKIVQRMMIAVSSLSTKPVVLASKFSLTISKSALEYAAKSGKVYSAEPEKTTTEAPKEDAAPAAA